MTNRSLWMDEKTEALIDLGEVFDDASATMRVRAWRDGPMAS